MKLATLYKLGMMNVATVVLYRAAVRSGLLERVMCVPEGYRSALFQDIHPVKRNEAPWSEGQQLVREAEELCQGNVRMFSRRIVYAGSPPDWFVNPNTGKRCSHCHDHWSRVKDFDPEVGDIKEIWELSRCDWALLFARAYRLTGKGDFLNVLNEWLADWTAKNPLNLGPNWKCGQETAIRMMQVLLTACLLEQYRTPSPGLKRFIVEHCMRIAPTLRYAMAQNNNHGTSEAAGLYLGGAWLEMCCPEERALRRKARKWCRIGRNWLENRVRKLISPDGSFAQYSLNYHRIVLDTLNMAEFWRRELQRPAFSSAFYGRARSAVEWLYQMIDPLTGDGPNLGANDGARVCVLSSTAYRDYRPSVQLGSVLFLGKPAYPEGAWNEVLFWLKLEERRSLTLSSQTNARTTTRLSHQSFSGLSGRKSCLLPDGGYVLMSFELAQDCRAWGLVRFPRFRFRPAHADALHFDLWFNGVNLLRDSGSYGYHVQEPWQSYFPGTGAHNTVQFGARDQMPRLSRFLFGEWLCMTQIGELREDSLGDNEGGEQGLAWTGTYCDYQQCCHTRTVASNGRLWRITDEFDSNSSCAVLRWRLAPGRWTLSGLTCVGDRARLVLHSPTPITRFELVDGWESRHYLEKTRLPVLEAHFGPGHSTLTTEVRLMSPSH